MNSSQRALAIALVVGAGLAAGFLSYRLQSSRPLLPSAGPPRAGVSADADAPGADAPGADAPGAVAPEAPPRPVPTTMPDLELPDLAGKARSLRSFGGRPLIINFWATWCAPCRREMPLLQLQCTLIREVLIQRLPNTAEGLL